MIILQFVHKGGDVHVATGMNLATKTYLEKRSWLHPLLSMHRVFEWHALTFTLLMAWGFSNQLVWTYAFTFQIGSFIFWEITFMSIIWTCLEVRSILFLIIYILTNYCLYSLFESLNILIIQSIKIKRLSSIKTFPYDLDS
jgi:hypothetical protein